MNIIHEVLKMETQAVVCVGASGTGAGEQYIRGFGEGDRGGGEPWCRRRVSRGEAGPGKQHVGAARVGFEAPSVPRLNPVPCSGNLGLCVCF